MKKWLRLIILSFIYSKSILTFSITLVTVLQFPHFENGDSVNLHLQGLFSGLEITHVNYLTHWKHLRALEKVLFITFVVILIVLKQLL